MSVIVEGISLVAVREDLDSVFPGAAYGFLNAASALGDAACYSCADSELVSVGFRDIAHAQSGIALLDGLVGRWVLVSADEGPLAPLAWIKWAVRGGVARAW